MATSYSDFLAMKRKLEAQLLQNLNQSSRPRRTIEFMRKYSKILTDFYFRMIRIEQLAHKLTKFTFTKEEVYKYSPEADEKMLNEIYEKMDTVWKILEKVAKQLNYNITPEIQSSINTMSRLRYEKLYAETSALNALNQTQKSEQEKSKLTEKQKEDQIIRVIQDVETKL